MSRLRLTFACCRYDRMEAIVDVGVPNVALAEYKAPENFPVANSSAWLWLGR
jgi:hypothetical protein